MSTGWMAEGIGGAKSLDGKSVKYNGSISNSYLKENDRNEKRKKQF